MPSLFLLSGCETVDDRKSKVLSDRPLSHGQLRGTERLKCRETAVRQETSGNVSSTDAYAAFIILVYVKIKYVTVEC